MSKEDWGSDVSPFNEFEDAVPRRVMEDGEMYRVKSKTRVPTYDEWQFNDYTETGDGEYEE